jgi:hypothetical protein
MQKAPMNTDPATPPSSAGLLDCLAEMAEGVRRDLVENPEANVIQFVAGSLFLIALMKIAEFYMRWKAGVLPARRVRAARPARCTTVVRPAQDAATPPAPPVRPFSYSCEPTPAPEHRAPGHPTPEHGGGSRPEADHARTTPNSGDDTTVAAKTPLPSVAPPAPQRPVFRPMSRVMRPAQRRTRPSRRPAAGIRGLIRSPPEARNFLRVAGRAAFSWPNHYDIATKSHAAQSRSPRIAGTRTRRDQLL